MATSTGTPHIADAGRRGPDVRSDCYVSFEPRRSGGIELVLASRVEAYYGESIRTQARKLLAQLGVEHARVAIEDQGALPFVIAARIEAAARRAGAVAEINIAGHHAEPELTEREPSGRDRLRRSRLYLPGNEPKYFINAALHGADGIILDLEDSVSAAEKDAARILVRNALCSVDCGGCERMVRINQLPLGLKDLQEIAPAVPDLVLIPKVEHAEQVVQVEHALQDFINLGTDRRPHSVWLMPILESALGIENAFAIAKASDRNVALTIGLEDYTADLGVVKTREGQESLYARMRVVNAAHAARLQAIDSVYGDIGDLDGLLAWGWRARALGYEGMGCVHPSQIPVIHEAFAPSAEELEKAQRIVDAYEQAKARGLSVVSLGSKMIDPPVVHRALKLVARAKHMGVSPDRGGASPG